MQEEIPRAEMAKLVEHFRGKPRTDDSIREYCNLEKIGYVPTTGELEDLEYQVAHDEKMLGLFTQILAELQNLAYVPELTSGKERKALVAQNENVRVNITKLFEDAGVSFRMIDKVANELGGMVAKVVEGAGTTAFNKAMDVLHHIAKEKFGGEFTMAHARDYAIEIYSKHAKNKEASVTSTPTTEVPEPNNSSEPQKEGGVSNNEGGN